MGVAQCDKHGEVGVVGNISLDVCKAVRAETELSSNKIRIIKIGVYDDVDFLFEDQMYVSETQFVLRSLVQSYVIRSDQDEQELNLILPETSGLCAECFKEYVNKFQVAIAKE
jgi:hypothetical protein